MTTRDLSRNLLRSTSRPLVRGVSGGSPYLDGVIDSVCCDLDATISDSYGGTGTNWANLIGSPADGAAQADYDFTKSSANIVFTGTAGDDAAYFLFNVAPVAGEDFRLAGGNTALTEDMHTTSVGQDYWKAIVLYTPTSTTFQSFMGTMRSNVSANGVHAYLANSGGLKLSYAQDNTATVTAASGLAPNLDAANVIIVSHSHSTDITRFWINSPTGTAKAHNFSESAPAAASEIYHIGRLSSGGGLIQNTRIYHTSIGNEFLDDTKAQAIIEHLETRHNRTYIP